MTVCVGPDTDQWYGFWSLFNPKISQDKCFLARRTFRTRGFENHLKSNGFGAGWSSDFRPCSGCRCPPNIWGPVWQGAGAVPLQSLHLPVPQGRWVPLVPPLGLSCPAPGGEPVHSGCASRCASWTLGLFAVPGTCCTVALVWCFCWFFKMNFLH